MYLRNNKDPTCMFTDKEDSGRGINTVTDREIQQRNEARLPQNTKRSTTCLTLLCNFVTSFDLPQNTNNDKTRQLHKSK